MSSAVNDTEKSGKIRTKDFLWYTPLVFSILFSYYCSGITTVDSGLYINKAFEFSRGEFDLFSRPGFIFLLGSTFKLLGPSVWSGMVLVRVFFVVNVFLIFFMTKYLFNKRAAFAASMTFLFSYYLNELSHHILLDNVHPSFVLLSIFLSILALDRKSLPIAVGAGLTFFYTYLVKETTILFLPFPILLRILWRRTDTLWSNLRQTIVTAGTACISIGLYHLVVQSLNRRTMAQQQLGVNSKQAVELLFEGNLIGTFHNAIRGFIGFWESLILIDIWLGCLFTASWIWIIFRSKYSHSSRSIAAIYILFIPAIVYLGLTNLRLGQAGMFLFATYIPVGVLLHDSAASLGKSLDSRFRDRYYLKKYASTAILLCFTVTICIYQIWFAVSASHKYLGETFFGRKVTGNESRFSLHGGFDEKVQKAAEIIKQHARPGDIILTGKRNFYAMQFFTDFQYQVSRHGLDKQVRNIFTLKQNLAGSLPSGSIIGRLLYLWPNRWANQLTKWNQAGELRIRYTDESIMLERFDAGDTVFVALDRRLIHIGEYLKQSPRAKKLSNDPPVFQVKNFSPVQNFSPPRVARQLGELLADLRDRNPGNYQIIRNDFFPEFFNIKPEQVDAIADLDEESAGVRFMRRK